MGDFPAGIVNLTAHRPWPVPGTPWIMTQSWHDLLFAHWPVPPDALRARVPPGVEVDLFDGEAWLGIVPFRMTNVAPRLAPTVPFVSAFNELNVRTYVTRDGKPGIYFFSLDADSQLAVSIARSMFRLPYYLARMQVNLAGASVEYRSRRTSSDVPAELDVVYEATGPVSEAEPGTLEYFLTERYCLYTFDRDGAVYRLEILHPPWPLQPAAADIRRNTMPQGIPVAGGAPLLHFSRRQDMVAWPLARVDR
jgi:uncharacterized protein YqjF (DUF2071 family)